MEKKVKARFVKMFSNLEGVYNSMCALSEDGPFSLTDLKDFDLMFYNRDIYDDIVNLFLEEGIIFRYSFDSKGEQTYGIST